MLEMLQEERVEMWSAPVEMEEEQLEKIEEKQTKVDRCFEAPLTVTGVVLRQVQEVKLQEERESVKSELSSVIQEMTEATVSLRL